MKYVRRFFRSFFGKRICGGQGGQGALPLKGRCTTSITSRKRRHGRGLCGRTKMMNVRDRWQHSRSCHFSASSVRNFSRFIVAALVYRVLIMVTPSISMNASLPLKTGTVSARMEPYILCRRDLTPVPSLHALGVDSILTVESLNSPF